MLKCNHCDKVYKYESERKRHQKSHFPQFECKICSKKFSFLSALRRHQKQHERTGSVQCHACGGNFRDEILLKRHMQYAHRGTFCCSECNTVLSSELALRTHSKIHKPESERRFRCNYVGCKKSFNFPHHLKHHELTHTNTKQHYCNVCGKGFIQSHHLKTHYKIHNPTNLQHCSTPNFGKKFTSKNARKKHIATHTKLNISATETRFDSGISSDSNSASDIREQSSDNFLCSTCGNTISRHEYVDHKLKCAVVPEDHCESKHLEGVNYNSDVKTPGCSNASVLVHNTLKESGKMKKSDADICISPEIFNAISEVADEATLGLKMEVNFSDANNNGSASSQCVGCSCAGNQTSFTSRGSEIISSALKPLLACGSNNMPQIEYRENGIVKIKETLDDDIIPIKEVYRENKSKMKNESTDLKYIPLNSCKAVLGNCIVSEDGSIGEGCLCAKMIVDEQQMSAQEIDELTPNPNAVWIT